MIKDRCEYYDDKHFRLDLPRGAGEESMYESLSLSLSIYIYIYIYIHTYIHTHICIYTHSTILYYTILYYAIAYSKGLGVQDEGRRHELVHQ